MNNYAKEELSLLMQVLSPLFITASFSFIYFTVQGSFSSLYFSLFSLGLVIWVFSLSGVKAFYFISSTIVFTAVWLMYFNWSTLFGLH